MKIKTDWQYDENGAVTGIDNGNCRVLVANVFGYDADQRDAHARLIAASPEMLEALKALSAWWDEGNAPIHPDSLIIGEGAILDELRAIISKAEGRE